MGVAGSFTMAYIGTYVVFPANIIGTAMGYCNIVARLATIFSPYVAELTPDSIS